MNEMMIRILCVLLVFYWQNSKQIDILNRKKKKQFYSFELINSVIPLCNFVVLSIVPREYFLWEKKTMVFFHEKRSLLSILWILYTYKRAFFPPKMKFTFKMFLKIKPDWTYIKFVIYLLILNELNINLMINVTQIKFTSMNFIVSSTSSWYLIEKKNIVENGKQNSRNVYTIIYIAFNLIDLTKWYKREEAEFQWIIFCDKII